jgi:hypothetical protein
MRWTLQSIGAAILASLLAVSLATAQEEREGERDFQGAVEVLYRNVNVEGSTRKYDEDFDGLRSGARLSGLWANWNSIDSNFVDFLRFDASGLGGDPHERIDFRMGRKDSYDFRASYWNHKYLYNLFDLVPDLDGSTWNSSRSLSDVDLTIHVTKSIDVFFEYQDVRRDGTSLFMKNINRDLYRLDTPLDQNVKRYSLGGKFGLGPVDLFFRQTLRRYEYRFNNSTDGDAGLSQSDLATLGHYDWRQYDRGDTDLTTLTLSAPLGQRVDITASVFGTLLGKEEITSDVALEAQGTSYRGTCSVTGFVCDPNNPCDAGVPGNVCVADPYEVTEGVSNAETEADYLVLDADLSVKIIAPLDFHFQVRSLNREITGQHVRDLDGNGVPDDNEGIVYDPAAGIQTSLDYTVNSIAGIIDYAPSSKVKFRIGYRTVDRKLERSGYEPPDGYRNTDFESDPDETIVLGLNLKPVRWFLLDADYEAGDISQPFTAVSPMEKDRLRVRAGFEPQTDMRLDLTYLGYKNTNNGVDFRQAGDCDSFDSSIEDGCWNTEMEGETYSASFWHKASKSFDYWFRWAQSDFDSVVALQFDTDFFGIGERGDSLYDNTSNQWAGQVNFSWARPWKGFLRFRINDSNGNNVITGPTFTNNLIIGQDYSDVEGGLTYTFLSGLYVGGRYRVFDYDDQNDLLDYDGDIFTIVLGVGF